MAMPYVGQTSCLRRNSSTEKKKILEVHKMEHVQEFIKTLRKFQVKGIKLQDKNVLENTRIATQEMINSIEEEIQRTSILLNMFSTIGVDEVVETMYSIIIAKKDEKEDWEEVLSIINQMLM